jgi:SRSO17 transposase
MGPGLEARFDKYCDPIVHTLMHADREQPARWYSKGLMQPGERKSVEPMAARVCVRAAHRDRPWDEEWLIIEWAERANEPAHYWFSNLPRSTPWQALIDTVMGRWRIERDYQELKQELGLGHYEGRNWRGFHHHASLCIAAYGFLLLERLTGSKKNAARFKAPRLPRGFRPRGAGADAAQ